MKTISSILLTLISSFFLTINAFAQKEESGIYKNVEDFKTRNLSLGIDCKTESHKIKLNDFFEKSYINVIHDSKEYKFEKKDIYGYQLCNGDIYRFNDNTVEYKILNPKEEILIYKHEENKVKGIQTVEKYFFSKNASSPIENLTLINLKKAFPTNHKFHDALDYNFKSDFDLTEYDSYHKMYKINHILLNNTTYN